MIDSVNPDISYTSSVDSVRQPVEDAALPFSDVLESTTALRSGSADLDAIFEAAGRRYNIPPNLLKAVARVESNFRPDVTSRVGAMGIMQLMPATARYLGVTDPFDPEQNIMGGAKYLREQLDRFDGDVRLALAAYNAGWPAVVRHGGIPPFQETQNYVPKVLSYFEGGDIVAGSVNLSSFGASGASGRSGSASTAALTEAMTQMLLVKIIEMQMSSSSDDKKNIF